MYDRLLEPLPQRGAAHLLSRLIYRTLMPDNLNIQMTSQMAITATTTYRIHCPTVLGSVRFSIHLLYLYTSCEVASPGT